MVGGHDAAVALAASISPMPSKPKAFHCKAKQMMSQMIARAADCLCVRDKDLSQ